MPALPLMLAALVVGCGPKKPVETAVAPIDRTRPPAPLPARSFALPDIHRGTLSNGLAVAVVENHEVPIVNVVVSFRDGDWTDPADRPGLAAAAMAMLDEGAGDLDGAGLSAALRALAAELDASAGDDGARVSLKSLKRNLEPSLALLGSVLTQPTFAPDSWQIVQNQRVLGVRSALQDPESIAARATARLMFGDSYRGLLTSEAAYTAMTRDEVAAWAAARLRPDRAVVLVGGDTTLAEITPLLEAALGGWGAPEADAGPLRPTPETLYRAEAATLFLVDKPGASQSVLTGGIFVGARTDDDATAFDLANMMFGGMFASRLNMNLREDKGYTYGARTYTDHSYATGLWTLTTSVQADATIPAVGEILTELQASVGDRAFTSDELTFAQGYVLGTWPARFEEPDYLLGKVDELWRYDLPEDFVSGYADRVRAVTPEAVNAAWRAHVDPARISLVVVGDAASLREGLAGLGLPVVELDRDGVPLVTKD